MFNVKSVTEVCSKSEDDSIDLLSTKPIVNRNGLVPTTVHRQDLKSNCLYLVHQHQRHLDHQITIINMEWSMFNIVPSFFCYDLIIINDRSTMINLVTASINQTVKHVLY